MQRRGICNRCGEDSILNIRNFSENSINILVNLGELEKHNANLPICDICYGELRQILIEKK